MIVAVCSDKGAPGVTTLATVLGLVWPGGAPVLEADPSGGDLLFRLRPALTPTQPFLPTEPSVFTLAADARAGLTGGDVTRYAQPSTLGVAVIPGPMRAERAASLRPLWPAVAQQLAESSGVVVADLGRIQPGHAAWPVAQAATAVLVVSRPDAEGLFHLRERAAELAHDLGGYEQDRNPVAAVMLTDAKQRRETLKQAEHLFELAGLPIPVAGWMAEDRSAVAALREGEMTRAVRTSDLLRSVTELTASLTHLWPRLQTSRPGQDQPAPPGPTAGQVWTGQHWAGQHLPDTRSGRREPGARAGGRFGDHRRDE